MINLPKYKTINCHAGKLPFYRGRNILNWALINDEKAASAIMKTLFMICQSISYSDFTIICIFNNFQNRIPGLNDKPLPGFSPHLANNIFICMCPRHHSCSIEILQEVYPITDEDDYNTLLNRAYSGCADVLYRAIS